MNKINETICAIGLQRAKRGWTWEECAAELKDRTGEDMTDEAIRSRYRYWLGDYLREKYGIDTGSDNHRNQGDEIRWEEEANTLTVAYTGPLISSLPDLIDHLVQRGVDMDEWQVDEWKCKAYPIYCANRQADLHWSQGRIEYGEVHSDGGLTVEQVFSVHAEFIRKEPVAVKPVLVPVVLPPVPEPEGITLRSDPVRCWLAAGDAHLGYKEKGPERRLIELQDRRALEVFVRAVDVLQPDGVVLAGDWWDLAEWSTHYVRNPHCVKMTQPSLIEGVYWLARVRAALGWGKRLVLLEGNHEHRIPLYLHKHLAHAADLRGVHIDGVLLDLEPEIDIQRRRAIGLPAWADLDRLGIEWVDGYPDAVHWLADNIRVEHGARALTPGHTAKEQSKQAAIHTVFFHIHRRERVTHTVYARDQNIEVTAICPGGLMHTDGRLPGAKERDQWQQGFLEIEFCEGDERVPPRFNVVPIQEGRAIVRNRLLEGTPARALHYLRDNFGQYNW